MKITAVNCVPLLIPYTDVNWKISRGAISSAEVVFVEIKTDQEISGVGCTCSGPIFISGESVNSIMDVIKAIAPQVLIGRNPLHIEDILTELDDKVFANNRAKAGIDLALYDLVSKILGISVCNFLGGSPKSSIPVMRWVGMQSPELMAERCIDLVNQGYKYLKLKMGTTYQEDLKRIEAIRASIGMEIQLAVDLNGKYDVKNAIKVINMLEDFEVALVEQPVPRGNLNDLRLVTKRVNINIEADESVMNLEEAGEVVRRHAADFVSIKLIKVGGINKARRIAALCESFGIGFVVGSTPGSQLIDAANTHLISSMPKMYWASELGEFTRMSEDPATGLKINNGTLDTPDKPGFGLEVLSK